MRLLEFKQQQVKSWELELLLQEEILKMKYEALYNDFVANSDVLSYDYDDDYTLDDIPDYDPSRPDQNETYYGDYEYFEKFKQFDGIIF